MSRLQAKLLTLSPSVPADSVQHRSPAPDSGCAPLTPTVDDRAVAISVCLFNSYMGQHASRRITVRLRAHPIYRSDPDRRTRFISAEEMSVGAVLIVLFIVTRRSSGRKDPYTNTAACMQT